MDHGDNQNLMPTGNLCGTGCGFFANDKFDGLCSKCYKDKIQRKQQQPQSTSPSIPSSSWVCVDPLKDSAASPDQGSVTEPDATQIQTLPACPSIRRDIRDEEEEIGKDLPHGEQSRVNDLSLDAVPKKKKNRCHICKKKVGLTGFGCRCGGLYCSEHRYSDKHDCQFDYHTDAQEALRKSNPVVVASKVEKL